MKLYGRAPILPKKASLTLVDKLLKHLEICRPKLFHLWLRKHAITPTNEIMFPNIYEIVWNGFLSYKSKLLLTPVDKLLKHLEICRLKLFHLWLRNHAIVTTNEIMFPNIFEIVWKGFLSYKSKASLTLVDKLLKHLEICRPKVFHLWLR